MNWLERARREISKEGGERAADSAVRSSEIRKILEARTAATAERTPTAVTAVFQRGVFEKPKVSNGSNGSILATQKEKTGLHHANEVTLRHGTPWESEGLSAADEQCVWCAGPGEHDDPLLWLGFAGTSGLLHQGCWLPWYASKRNDYVRQKERASMVLSDYVLRGPHKIRE